MLRPGGSLGLIHNEDDPHEDWEVALTGGHPPRWSDDDPPTIAGLPGGEVIELATFPWIRRLTAAEVRANLATQSAVAIMDTDEREHFLDAMAAVVAAEASRRGTDTVAVNQMTVCRRVRF